MSEYPFLRLETGKPILATLKSYKGEKTGQYGLQHIFIVEVDGKLMTWTFSEVVKDKMKRDGIESGAKVVIEKVFSQGKNHVNIYLEGDVLATAKLESAKTFSKEKSTEVDKKEKEIRYGLCCNMASRQFKPLETNIKELIEIRANSILILADELYSQYKLPED